MHFPPSRWVTRTLGIGLLAVSLAACGGKTDDAHKSGTDTLATPKAPDVGAPAFSADSAYAFVVKQLSFGPRVPNTPGHVACGDWFIETFKRYGATVTVQAATLTDHKGQKLQARNIIASYNPDAPDRILLSAHWDSRPVSDMDPHVKDKPVMGANDGASGVAVLLEIARNLQAKNPGIGVDLILWDAEDGGDPNSNNPDTYCLGSQYWGKNPHKPGYKARYGVNLDMVGASGAVFPQEGYSRQYAQGPMDKIWQTGHALGYGQYFSFQPAPPITDDHYYMSKVGGVNSLDIIHLNLDGTGSLFFEHWHTQRDDISTIDPNTLKAVGQTLLQVLFQEAKGI